MWIRLLIPAAGPHFSYHAGQVVDVADETAEEWIRERCAEAARPPLEIVPAASGDSEGKPASDPPATDSAFKKLTSKKEKAARSGNPAKAEKPSDDAGAADAS